MQALALVCTLKPSPSDSSTDLIARQVLDELDAHGVAGDVVRVVDHDVHPGIADDMGSGDEWPGILDKVKDADVLLLATPTWLGHMSSIAQRTLERLNAQLSSTDDEGRPAMFGKVGVVAVVGNEDGAHKIVADVLQGLNDTGFSIPAQGATYWNHEAMNPKDYKDLEETPAAVAATTATLATNAAHLARLLSQEQYPSA